MSRVLFEVTSKKDEKPGEYILWDYTWKFYSDYTAEVDGLKHDGYHFFRWRVRDGRLEAYREGLEYWIRLPECAQEGYQAYLVDAVMSKLTISDRVSVVLRMFYRKARTYFRK